MTVNLHTKPVTVPTVYVTKGRQRVKQHDNYIVYLKNGDEFEIEIFNPTINKVLAKISLNGKSLGSGIVLRPGERVFLERYLDEAKKFLFETYEVEGNDSNVKEAIKMNGILSVEFYDEYRNYTSTVTTWTYQNPSWTTLYYPGTWTTTGSYTSASYYNNNSIPVSGRGSSLGSAKGVSAQNDEMTFNCCANFSDEIKSAPPSANRNSEKSYVDSAPLETGRVEKGSNSNQDFSYDSTRFNSYYSWNYTWKILPESQKPLVKEDLKVFCHNCGSKRKKSSHKFCPNCGQKFN